MITLEKVRGKPNYYWVVWKNEEGKTVSWPIDGADLSVDVLQDIINTVRPPIQPTVPAIPVDPTILLTQDLSPWINPKIHSTPGAINATDAKNLGAEAADKAARDEEMRLRNMGSAISRGIGLGPDDIPVVDVDRVDLPDVNWGV